MRVGSLFTGYGGLDLATEAALGGTPAWFADNEPAAAAVLAHHWPETPNLGDITAADWAAVEPVDVLTGGWPCQPWSHAGQRKGTEDDRALWPEVARAVRALRPRHVVLENVPGVIAAGELARVADSLAALGYDLAWTCLGAAQVGAPHRRNRVFILATADADGQHAGAVSAGDRRGEPETPARNRSRAPADPASHRRHQGESEPARLIGRSDVARDGAPAADTDQPGPQGAEPTAGHDVSAWGDYAPAIDRWAAILGRPAPAPTQTGRRGGQQLAPAFVEWLMGLPAGHVTDVPDLTRNQQLRLLGNGVVPQQAAAGIGWLADQLNHEQDAA